MSLSSPPTFVRRLSTIILPRESSGSPESRNPHSSVVVSFTQGGLDWYEDKYFWRAESYPVMAETKPHYLYWSEKVAPRIKDSRCSPKVTEEDYNFRQYFWLISG
jgi:hypothetical protein